MSRQISDLKNLNQKVVLITGASGGLGKEMAYQVAAKGAIVVACARSMDKLDVVRQHCALLSKNTAYAYSLDVSDAAQIERVVEQIQAEVGSVDILINNAGFGYFENALNFKQELVEKMFRVNVLGLIYLTQLVGQQMVANRQAGQIINIASQAGKMATQKSAIYSATKFAVLGYSNALRLELAPYNIQVTTVNPGPIETNFFNVADQSGTYLKSVDFIVLKPEQVAHKIVRAIGTRRREINVPCLMEVASRFYTLFPSIGDFIAGKMFNKK